MKHHVLLCIKDFRSGIDRNKRGVPFKSGAEFHAERHAEEMTRQGHQVTIFAKKKLWRMPDYEIMREGYALHRLWPVLRAVSLIYWLLSRYRTASALHIMGKPDFAAFAVPVAQILGIPVSLEVTIVGEVFDSYSLSRRLRHPIKLLRQAMFRRCDLFIANTREIADDLIGRGIPAAKVIRHPQGIDVERFYPVSDTQKERLRQELGLPLTGQLFLFCCRIVHRKGIDLLLAAWPTVRKTLPEAQLIIVGGGEPEWLQRIQELMQKDNRILYVDEVPNPVPYYQACDAYVFPSRREGLPTSLMEAMGCGLAPVVSAIGGNVDLVDEQAGTGIICPAEDAAELGQAMIRLLTNGKSYREVGAAARRFIVEHLDRRELVVQLLERFTDMQSLRPKR